MRASPRPAVALCALTAVASLAVPLPAPSARAEETWDLFERHVVGEAELEGVLESARPELEACIGDAAVRALVVRARVSRNAALGLRVRARPRAPEVEACADTVVRRYLVALLEQRIPRPISATLRVRPPAPASP